MFLGSADNAGSGAVLLHAAILAAVAGNGLVPVDGHVTDLAACALRAAQQLAFHNDTTANTGAQSSQHHIPAALAAALPELAHGSHIGIITCLHGEAGESFQLPGNVEPAPAQVHALIHSAIHIHRTGNADAKTDDGLSGDVIFTQVAFHCFCNVGQDLAAALGGVGRDLPLVEHSAVFVEICQLDGGAAKVNTKAVLHR